MNRRTLFKVIAGAAATLTLPPTLLENVEEVEATAYVQKYWPGYGSGHRMTTYSGPWDFTTIEVGQSYTPEIVIGIPQGEALRYEFIDETSFSQTLSNQRAFARWVQAHEPREAPLVNWMLNAS